MPNRRGTVQEITGESAAPADACDECPTEEGVVPEITGEAVARADTSVIGTAFVLLVNWPQSGEEQTTTH